MYLSQRYTKLFLISAILFSFMLNQKSKWTLLTQYAGNSTEERSVKDIELFFDASTKNNFVLTCGKVLHDISK